MSSSNSVLDSTTSPIKMQVDISLWLQDQHSRRYRYAEDGRGVHQDQYSRPYGIDRGGMIPISPYAIPPWWRTFSQHYERFSNSLETFLRSSEICRLECAEVLTIDFQNMTRMILDRIFWGNDHQSTASGRSGWEIPMSRSSSSSSESSLPNQHRRLLVTQPPYYQHQDADQPSTTSNESPYSSPVYSYSCPSSIGRQTYTQHLEGITLALDALYFLLQAAQDLTDLSLHEIRTQRLDTLQLNPNSLKLAELPNQLCITIHAIIRKLLSWDHGLIRKKMKRMVIMGQLEELCEWVDEDGEMPYWRLGEGFEELRRIREWRKDKVRSVWGIIWDWIVL